MLKRPQQVANFLGYPIAMDQYGNWFWFEEAPVFMGTATKWEDVPFVHALPYEFIKYEGEWKTSLRVPRSWKK